MQNKAKKATHNPSAKTEEKLESLVDMIVRKTTGKTPPEKKTKAHHAKSNDAWQNVASC